MVKQKLTQKEEEKIAEQLKLFIKPKSLPDILRKAILSNKGIPDQYDIYIPTGDYDDKEHFVNAEQALQAFENNELTDLDKLTIQRLLSIPKIVDRIDYEFKGLVTKVKNSLVEGAGDLSEDVEKPRLHKKPKSMDLLTGEAIKKPEKKDKEKVEEIKEIKEKREENVNANEQPHTGNIFVRRKNVNVSEENIKGEREASNGTEPNYIEFREDEDY